MLGTSDALRTDPADTNYAATMDELPTAHRLLLYRIINTLRLAVKLTIRGPTRIPGLFDSIPPPANSDR
jgi:hypothetical protein